MTNYKQASQLVSDILGLKYDKFFYGDIVATSDQYELMVLDDRENPPSIVCFNELLNEIEEYNNIDDLILIQRNISLPMVLEAMNIKKVRYDIYKDTVNLDIIYLRFYFEIKNSKSYFSIIKNKQAKWILRKDGKDCNLSDQSEELCKLIPDVLK